MRMTMSRKKIGNKTRNVIWWGLFLFPAVMLQRLVPGSDFLLVGLLVSLQEKRFADLLWAVPLVLILQEGMGTQQFGVILLWHTAVCLLFFLGSRFFDVESFLYLVLFSACLGVCHFAVVFFTTPLYNTVVDAHRLLDESAYLALLLPPVWKAARLTRSWIYADEAAAEK